LEQKTKIPGVTTNKSKPMNLKEIQELIKFVSESGVSEVELEKGDFKIAIRSASSQPAVTYHPPVQQVQAAPVVHQATAPAKTSEAPPAAPAAKEEGNGNLITIKSPMIGTFYAAPSPDKPPYLNVGDVIKQNQVICIIEAMKLFNEIESEVSGKVVKILVDSASPVEYDQPLFLVEPA
jgi:acetyl-CoA carboxylase biotin carboxyl carrier protein